MHVKIGQTKAIRHGLTKQLPQLLVEVALTVNPERSLA